MTDQRESTALAGDQAEPLLGLLASWQNTTTIVIHGGCVFEYKGCFPAGSIAQGFYNLHSDGEGFEGHLNLDVIDRISFQDKLHRGRQSYAFVFENKAGECIFKVFVGRDAQGELHASQVEAFQQIRQRGSVA